MNGLPWSVLRSPVSHPVLHGYVKSVATSDAWLSMVLESLQASTCRLCQSMVATRYDFAMGMR